MSTKTAQKTLEELKRKAPKAEPLKPALIDPQAPLEPAPKRTAVTTVPDDNRTYISRYLDEISPNDVAGRRVKFVDGQYLTVDDKKPLPEKDTYILLGDDTCVGWIRFNGENEKPDKVAGLLFDDFHMPPREALGDLDKSVWEPGLDQKPADPWLHFQALVLQHTVSGELFTFSTTTVTGRNAVGALLRHYTRMRRNYPDDLPIIRLDTGSFEHKDKRVGRVEVPLFVVVGRAPRDSATKPDTSVAAYLNDDLPDNMKK